MYTLYWIGTLRVCRLNLELRHHRSHRDRRIWDAKLVAYDDPAMKFTEIIIVEVCTLINWTKRPSIKKHGAKSKCDMILV